MLRIVSFQFNKSLTGTLRGGSRTFQGKSRTPWLRRASTTLYTPINQVTPKIPDVLLIYHAGTLSTIFLGIFKVSTVVVFAFTAVVWAPKLYKDSEQGPLKATALVLSSILPLAFMIYYTRPFVISVHLRVPMHARESATSLARYIDSIPKTARIEMSVMQTIPVPGSQQLRIGNLKKLKSSFISIANLGLRNTASLPEFKSSQPPTSFWKQSTNKFYIGRNTLSKQRSVIWDRIWSSIP